MRDKYHIKNNKKVFLYPNEWKQFFSSLSDKQEAYFKIVINTGARINEILNLTPSDINNNRNQITFRITKIRSKKGEKRPEPRTIQISSEFKSWLFRYIKKNNIKNNELIISIG